MIPWFILCTGFQQEQRAERELLNQRINNWLPLTRVEERTRAGLLVTKLKPLFTGYIFVQVSWARSSKVRSTKGIKYFVGWVDGCVPPYLTNAEVEELRQQLNSNEQNVVSINSRPKEIEPGMMARILFGPYRDRTVPVTATDGSRVEVILHLLGRDVPKKLDKDCLLAVA